MRGAALLLALLLGPAAAADMDDLTRALTRARTLAARGQVTVTVNFPPRDPPARPAAQLPAVPFRPALLKQNFTVSRAGAGVIAGRAVTLFHLVPRHAGAARWTLWVDDAWQVPLAFEERRAGGAVARHAAFVQVNAALAPVKRPVPGVPAGLRAAVLRAVPGLQFPPGFVPVAVQDSGGRRSVTLSDGVNVVALVLAPRGVNVAAGVASRRVTGGAVWLVGNLPDASLNAALAGVRQVRRDELGTFLARPASNP